MNNYKIYHFNETIFPNKLIYDSKFYKIRIIDSTYIIKSFEVHTNSEKIEKIKINANHPNCNPENQEFCIPECIKGLELNNENLKIIISMLQLFNFQNSYYCPWLAFERVND